MGKIDFNGVELEVCLEAVPEAKVANTSLYMPVFAISSMSESDAQETLDILEKLGELEEFQAES